MEQVTSQAAFEEMVRERDMLRAQNESLRRAAIGKVTLKVGKAGGVSMYGMGRYPVTLYRSQWERLIQAVPQVQAFIEAHASELSTKAE